MEQRIKNLIRRLKEISIAEKQLGGLVAQKQSYIANLYKLEDQIEAKYYRIDALTSMSVRALYHKLLGNRASELDSLKTHYLELSIQYNTTAHSLAEVSNEISQLEALVESQESVRTDLNHQLQHYEATLKNTTLASYRVIAKAITAKLQLAKEVEEAIDQGVIANKKLNKTIDFLKSKSKEILLEIGDRAATNRYPVSNLTKYQAHITSLKHSLVKLDIEIADIYDHLTKDSTDTKEIAAAFDSQYRLYLAADLTAQKTMNDSYQFLKNTKARIMSITRSLRSDLRRINKELSNLEGEERALLDSIKEG